MRPVMYLISNPSIPMSTGKRGAQLAHAAVEAYIHSPDNNTKRVWHRGGHYTKIVLQTDDLRVAERYLNDRGFDTELIIDEGHTEFDADLTPTALGCCIVDRDDAHVQATFSSFKLYSEETPGEAFQRGKLVGYFSRGDEEYKRGWNNCVSSMKSLAVASGNRRLRRLVEEGMAKL